MVDCGSPQCAQDRRNFRKELLSWSKKVPVTIALEKIAEEFAGKEAIQLILEPFNCLEPETGTDWVPEEDCFYCDSKLPLINDVVSKLAEDVKNGKAETDNPSVRLLQELLPYCPQFYTHGYGRERIESSSGNKQAPSAAAAGGGGGEEGDMVVPSAKSHVELKIPHIPIQASKHKKDCTVNGKKSYTDDELTAAVHDIRTGKLGTRRAAMLYGIPRSTLRNKIFKLENEDVIPDELDHEDSSSTEDMIGGLEGHSMKLADLMQASPFTYTLPPLPFTLPFRKDYDFEEQEEEYERRIELLRRKHNFNGSHENLRTPAHANELKLPILVDLIRKLVEQRLAVERQSASITIKTEPGVLLEESLVNGLHLKDPFLPSSLPSTATCLGMTPASLADIRIPSYKPANGTKDHSLPDKSSMAKVYDTGTIGETLKNIIVRSINEKIKIRETHDDSSGTATPDDMYRVSVEDSLSAHFITTPLGHALSHTSHQPPSTPSPPKRHKKDSDKDKPSSGSSSSTLKKTRPKRGQYRKYNSQLLMEAVRAVQRGEMSVHRAGSYFGVPHSTLEYKVKERHLLRQKKQRETTSSQKPAVSTVTSSSSTSTAAATAAAAATSDSNSSSSSITSASTLSTTTTAAAAAAATVTAKSDSAPTSALGFGTPKQTSSSGSPWFQPYLNGSPHFDPAMSFFHSGFALNTPASELLRKLQHKVQSKSGTFPPENSFDFPRPNGVGSLQERFLLFN